MFNGRITSMISIGKERHDDKRRASMRNIDVIFLSLSLHRRSSDKHSHIISDQLSLVTFRIRHDANDYLSGISLEPIEEIKLLEVSEDEENLGKNARQRRTCASVKHITFDE